MFSENINEIKNFLKFLEFTNKEENNNYIIYTKVYKQHNNYEIKIKFNKKILKNQRYIIPHIE